MVVAHEVSLGVKAVVALLLGAEGEVDAGAVQAHRRAGFHAPGLEAEGNELLCDAPGSGFRETSAGPVALPYVHQTVEEGADGQHHFGCPKFDSHGRFYAFHVVVFRVQQQAHGHVLVEVETGNGVEFAPPFVDVFGAVYLRTWGPYGGALGTVEHPELYGAAVGDDAGATSEGVYLAHDLPLGDTSHGGVAAHLGDTVHVGCQKESTDTHGCGGRRGLAAGVSGSHHYYVVFVSHSRS